MTSINERWTEARKKLGYTQLELSDVLSTPRPTLAGYERGANIPTSSIRAFSAICHVRESYLLNGDLPILEPEAEKTPVQKVMEEFNLPPVVADMLEEWLLLSEEQQKASFDFCRRVWERRMARMQAEPLPDPPE